MPIGIISNVLAVIIGGIIGAILGNKMSADFKEKLNMILAPALLPWEFTALV